MRRQGLSVVSWRAPCREVRFGFSGLSGVVHAVRKRGQGDVRRIGSAGKLSIRILNVQRLRTVRPRLRVSRGGKRLNYLG